MTDEMRTIIRESAARITETCGGEELFHARGCALPEHAEVVDITEKLRALLFPGFFGDVSTARSEYAAGYALTGVCARLRVQLEAAFCYAGNGEIDVEEKAESVLKVFISSLPEVQKLLLCDVEAAFDGDPAAKSRAGVVFSYPGLHAITVYRLAHILYKEEVPFIPRIMTEYAHSLTGIDINAGAEIGRYFFIDHGTGVVIGETAVIGDFVKLYQGVTLGALSTRLGQKLAGVKRHPTLGNRVTVYSGASVLGGETVIGDDCVIGGNAFVTSFVPPHTRVSMKSPELTFREMNRTVWEKA